MILRDPRPRSLLRISHDDQTAKHWKPIFPASNWSNFLQFCSIWCLQTRGTELVFFVLGMACLHEPKIWTDYVSKVWLAISSAGSNFAGPRSTDKPVIAKQKSTEALQLGGFLQHWGQMYAWNCVSLRKMGVWNQNMIEFTVQHTKGIEGEHIGSEPNYLLLLNSTLICLWAPAKIRKAQDQPKKGLGTTNQFPHHGKCKNHQKPIKKLFLNLRQSSAIFVFSAVKALQEGSPSMQTSLLLRHKVVGGLVVSEGLQERAFLLAK